MTQLWLVPVDERSYQQTLAEPVNLTDLPQKPANFPDRARVWGVRTDPNQGDWKRNRRNLERMETGDPLLIYRNETSQYRAKGRIGPQWHTTHVRDEFWNGGPAIDVFAVEDYTEIDADPEDINNLLGYKPQFRPQGLSRVAKDRPYNRVIRRFEI